MSSNYFLLIVLSILRVLINLCRHQLQWPHVATNISQHLKMGPVLATESKLYQTEMYTPNWQCVEVNGAGAWASTIESGLSRVRLGRGPITYPTGKPFGFWKLVENGTSFYVGTKRLVKLIERKEQLALHTSEWKFQYLRRKMTVGVTDGLWRITPK